MPLINKTWTIKRLTFIVIPEKVHQDLLKLDGIDLLGRKLLLKEAISTRKKDLKENKRPSFVVNSFLENQVNSSNPELYLATSRMRQPSVSVKSTQHMKKGLFKTTTKKENFYNR